MPSSASLLLFFSLLAFLLINTSALDVEPLDQIMDQTGFLEHSEKVPLTGHAYITGDISANGFEDGRKSLLLSFFMIIASEIGDKTFLIAAIMAMKHPRWLIFSAALSSLVLMSCLSAFLGHAVPNLIPKIYTNYLASLLFLCFGVKMFADGWSMTEAEGQEEMREVEEEIEHKEETELLESAESGKIEHSSSDKVKIREGTVNLLQLLFSPTFVQTFIMTFLAEWGDRSQIATIALGAANNVYFVTFGTIIGHTLCTAVAVIGGRMLASRISVRKVTLFGAGLFICFSIICLYEGLYGV